MIKDFLVVLSKPNVSRIGLASLMWLLIAMPGQNSFQTLVATESEGAVRRVSVANNEASDYPVWNELEPAPYISARAAIVLDVGSGAVLYEKNPDWQLMPASTTKIMTALVALELYDLDEVVTVNDEDRSIGSSSDLEQGERISVENLLYAMMVSSGNDAALALAQHYKDGYSGFVEQMNIKAVDLNLVNTHFSNVSGLEQLDHITSVRDMALLSKEAVKNKKFVEIVSTKEKTISSIDGQVVHDLENINQLLGEVEGIRGVKTGFTTNSGECLVANVVRLNREIITVVLGSQDRFEETKALIEWAYENHVWKESTLD